MKTKMKTFGIAAIGLILLAAGIVAIKMLPEAQGVPRALPYLCIGVGCGLFGQGMGEIISRKVSKNRPDLQRKMEIEKNDERNVAIANRAKAKAYDVMVFVFGALMLAFALMEVNWIAILMLVFAYLFVIFLSIYYRVKYDKEM